jgi:hypothetical protein
MNRMRRQPLRHLTFTLGVAITALLIVTAVLSLVYTPQDPLAMSITGRLQGPSGEHLFRYRPVRTRHPLARDDGHRHLHRRRRDRRRHQAPPSGS